MWLNAATDLPVPVDELWRGSVLHGYDLSTVPAMFVPGTQYFVWAVLVLIFFCMIFRTPVGVFFSWAGGFLRSPAKRSYSETSASIRYGLPLSLAVFLPVFSFLVYGSGMVAAPYGVILGVLTAYFLIRLLILRGVSYCSGEKELVQSLYKVSLLFFMLLAIVFSVVFIIGMFLPDVFPLLVGTVSPVMAAAIMAVYYVEVLRIIFAFREPLFLSIVYLCTLEILPVALAVAVIIKF
ncbi:MAG TPA: DUF4271 domain-containing protein [Candidatus Coprenecus pullistercoris]|nr:DUF4271 domain-containing protein [Candidatus Coprenecus pullistercoris]